MDCEENTSNFVAADYSVFGVMLALSAGIGIFFAVMENKRGEGVQGYLMAGRQMNFFPSAVSLSLTLISSVTILGLPAEIYFYGSTYIWFIASVVWALPILIYVYVSFFYKLGVTSTFEYLGSRFNNPVRLATTAVYVLQNIMFIGIMIYAPALALEAVTGFNLWAAIFTIGLVCTFYTTLGGLKAVIWTDVFQGIIVVIATLVILILGTENVGGFNNMWEINQNGSRIDFWRFEADPRYRTTFWSMVFGLGTSYVSMFGVNQAQVQRFLCCRTLTGAKLSLTVGIAIAFFLLLCFLFQGFIAYAYFHTCDPISWFRITGSQCGVGAPDQILPYMVMQMFGERPGLPGLYVAGVFAGCLSTVSSGINAMACVTLRDFIAPFVTWREKTHAVVSKVLVFVFGFICIAFACLASIMGNVLQAALSIQGVVGGPTLGVFALGMMLPYPNSIGTGIGLAFGLFMSGWIYIGSETITIEAEYLQRKPLNVMGCKFPPNFTMPAPPPPTPSTNPLQDFYSVSYAHYASVGCCATLVCGLLISIITRYFNIDNGEVPPRLVWTNFDRKTWRFLPESVRKFLWCNWDSEERADEKAPDNKVYPETVDYKVAVDNSYNKASLSHANKDGTPSYKSSKNHHTGNENVAYIDDEKEDTTL